MAGREGWKTGAAGRTAEKPEQKREGEREREAEKHTHIYTVSQKQRPQSLA